MTRQDEGRIIYAGRGVIYIGAPAGSQVSRIEVAAVVELFRRAGLECKLLFTEWHLPGSDALMHTYDGNGLAYFADAQKPVATVLRGEPPPVRCSMARTGDRPWIKSTSGRFNCSSNCRADAERLSMYLR